MSIGFSILKNIPKFTPPTVAPVKTNPSALFNNNPAAPNNPASVLANAANSFTPAPAPSSGGGGGGGLPGGLGGIIGGGGGGGSNPLSGILGGGGAGGSGIVPSSFNIGGGGGGGGNPLSGIIGGGGGNPLSGIIGGGGGGGGLLGGIIGNSGSGGGDNPGGGLAGWLQKMGGNVAGGLFNDQTDPWNIFHKKAKVDSTGEVEDAIDKYAKENPYTSARTGPNGTLPDNLTAKAATADAGQGFLTKAGNVSADTSDLQAIQNRANAVGDSPWAALQKQQNELNRVSQMDQAGQAAMGQAAGARSDLAMHGGLESGASERIAENAARSTNANQMAINRGAQQNALGIGVADDQSKMGLLGQAANLDLQNAGFNLGQNQFNASAANAMSQFNAGQTTAANEFNASAQNATNAFNIGNTLSDIQNQNTFNTSMFGAKMQGFGGAKSADAIQNAGKK